ncbi:MAG: hypothetical protein ACOZJX_10495 [Pseudomonadota bacterium]
MKTLLALKLLALVAGSAAAQTLTWSVPPRGVAIAADAAENVYTADWEYNPGGDITLTKTSPWGVTLFSARHDNTNLTRMDAATWVETDSAGGALVSGTVLSGFSNPVPANALLMRFAADGTLLWRTIIGDDFDGGSTFRVLRDAQDNAYVLGLGPTPGGARSRIHKVTPDGVATLFWYDTLGIGLPANFKWGRDGSLVVAMRARTGVLGGAVLIGPDGQTLRTATAVPALSTVDAAADAQGNLYVASIDPGTSRGRLACVAAALGGDWQVSDSAALARVEVAPDGAIVAGGQPGTGAFGVAFVKYSPTGTLIWENRDADGPGNAFLSHGQMRLDGEGNAYLAASDLSQMTVTRGNADGSFGWAMKAPFGTGVALAFGAASKAVYVVGGQVARIDQGGSPPPPAPDLAVTLSDAPDPVPRDGELTLTTTIRNLGSGAASAATLKHRFAGGPVRVVSATASQGSCSSGSAVDLTCSLGAIAPGGSVTVVQVVRPRRAGTLVTTATAATASNDPIPGNNQAIASTSVRRR